VGCVRGIRNGSGSGGGLFRVSDGVVDRIYRLGETYWCRSCFRSLSERHDHVSKWGW
jgi:hypothetical protein